jgi:hypothetical protein
MEKFINIACIIFRKDFYRSENLSKIIIAYLLLFSGLIVGFIHLTEAWQYVRWWQSNQQQVVSEKSKYEKLSIQPSTKSSPYSGASKNEKRGSKYYSKSFASNKISSLQKLLRIRGCKVGSIDGILGPQTLQAIRQYQEANKRFEFNKGNIGAAIDFLKRNKGSCYTSSKLSFRSGVYICTTDGRENIKLTFLNSELTHVFLRGWNLNVAKRGRIKINEKLFFEAHINYSNLSTSVGIQFFSSRFEEVVFARDKVIFLTNTSKYEAWHHSSKQSDLGEVSYSRNLSCK